MDSRRTIVAAVVALGMFSFGMGVTEAAVVGVPVTVVNGPSQPVPVVSQGTTSVSGAVAATQSGPWAVSVASMPIALAAQSGPWTVSVASMPNVNIANAIQSGDRTDVIKSGRVTFSDRLSPLAALQDLTQYKTVRLIITSTGSSSMEARVYEVDAGVGGATPILIDAFAVPANLTGSIHYYDLPGSHFSVDILNNSPGVDQTYQYFLLGRRN